MAKAILHIGTAKTGTTSLQAFFYANRTALEEGGFCFPPCKTRQPRNDETQNGAFLLIRGEAFNAWANISRLLSGSIAEDVRTFRGSAQSGLIPIISEENLSYLKRPCLGPVKRLLRRCGFDEVKVIAYVRPQDSFLISNWKQACESGYRTLDVPDFISLKLYRRWADYRSFISGFERCFGRGSVIIRRFENGALEGGSIYRDFCAAVGIPWNGSFQIPADRNLSVRCDVAEAMCLITKRGFPVISSKEYSPDRKRLMEIAEQYSLEHPEATGTFPLEPDRRQALMDSFAECNAWLSERFFSASPFPAEPVPQEYPVWKPNAERAESIAAELLARFDRSE